MVAFQGYVASLGDTAACRESFRADAVAQHQLHKRLFDMTICTGSRQDLEEATGGNTMEWIA